MENNTAYLFQPDVLITHSMLRKPQLGPEKRLMLAVLQDAVECFQKYIFFCNGKEEYVFRDAEEWFLERDSEWLFSFENICESLELNAEYLRRGLWLWQERTKKRAPVLNNQTGQTRHMRIAS